MINEITRRLENSEKVELECVEPEKYSRGNDIDREMLLKEKNIKVIDVVYREDLGCVVCVVQGEKMDHIIEDFLIKYFCVKPTFDDLIDVAVQAYKDGVLSNVDLRDNEIFLTGLGVIDKNRNHVFQSAVDDIKSLYTETFVIESEEDELRIKQPVKSIVLANGVEIIGEEKLMLLHSVGLCINGGAVGGVKIPFSLLKGATVTQRKSNK